MFKRKKKVKPKKKSVKRALTPKSKPRFIHTTPAERGVLALLIQKPHNKYRVNFYNIARKLEISTSTAGLSLRNLRAEGLVEKSFNGAWHIVKDKEELVKNLLAHPFPKFKVAVKTAKK